MLYLFNHYTLYKLYTKKRRVVVIFLKFKKFFLCAFFTLRAFESSLGNLFVLLFDVYIDMKAQGFIEDKL